MLIVGLGNPGSKYAKTKHNIGFWMVDKLANDYAVDFKLGKGNYMYSKHNDITFLKPLTYMNDSGSAVIEFMDDQAKGNNNLLIVYDDKDLPLGKIRLRPNGSAGGHNGVRSIIDALGTEEFPRLRIGIGSSVGKQDEDVINYVLGRFDTDEEEILASTLVKAGDCIEMYIKSGIEKAMNKFN